MKYQHLWHVLHARLQMSVWTIGPTTTYIRERQLNHHICRQSIHLIIQMNLQHPSACAMRMIMSHSSMDGCNRLAEHKRVGMLREAL